MTIEASDIISLLLGGGLITSLGTLWWNRGKLRVDQQVTTVDGLSALVDRLQNEIGAKDSTIKEERARAEACEDQAREARVDRDDLLRENGALRHELDSMEAYLKATLTGVAAGTIPPWLTAPYVLHHRLPPEAMPDWALSPRHDTGTPGVDPPDPI